MIDITSNLSSYPSLFYFFLSFFVSIYFSISKHSPISLIHMAKCLPKAISPLVLAAQLKLSHSPSHPLLFIQRRHSQTRSSPSPLPRHQPSPTASPPSPLPWHWPSPAALTNGITGTASVLHLGTWWWREGAGGAWHPKLPYVPRYKPFIQVINHLFN